MLLPWMAGWNVLTISPAAAAFVLGSSTYPRPCSGYASEAERMMCFCHYHPEGGTYVWPFSSGNQKCRQAIQCQFRNPTLTPCPEGTVADDLELNGETQCAPQPERFDCSNGGAPSSLPGVFLQQGATCAGLVDFHFQAPPCPSRAVTEQVRGSL
jgi:hypothetical protein